MPYALSKEQLYQDLHSAYIEACRHKRSRDYQQRFEYGVEGTFCGKIYKYLYWGEYRYWMMDPTPEECDLINRCIIPNEERKPENFPNIIRLVVMR